MALALDEPNENDEVVEVEGYKVVMEKELLEKAKPVTVDMSPFGFAVKSNMEMEGGGDSCSSCSSCG
ncbi:MAG: hypothetical protein F6K39_02145 [Okeania sp. SIO3B3]|nr:hypothetical protein [Okeania sp. SIO3B3]